MIDYRIKPYPQIILFIGLLLTISVKPAFGDLFYKEVALGLNCTFKISRFWSEGDVDWELPLAVRGASVDFKANRYTGKEVMLDAAYVKYIRKANMDGVVSNVIQSALGQPGITDFKYKCSDYLMPGTFAKTCIMSYKNNRTPLYTQSLFFIPDSDVFSLYTFSANYLKPYSRSVVDKIFSSIRIR